MSRTAFVTAAALLATALPVRAAYVDLPFGCISQPRSNACATGEAQFQLRVADVAGLPDHVLFTFTNAGGASSASSITDVYFDDGTLLAIARIIDSAGVHFSPLATPGNLPGGNNATPPFQVTRGFSADSDPPVQPSGVNPGEGLGILFSLKSEGTYDIVLHDLAGGGLRVGIHAQGFAGGESASFINAPLSLPLPAPVPVPAALPMTLAGLGLLGFAARRRGGGVRDHAEAA